MILEYDLVIIGAGPAGIMAGLEARDNNKDISIVILESQTSLGKKLRMTGGGRCNFTNNDDIGDFFDNIVTNSKFLYSALYGFSNEDMKSYIRKLGLDYKVEKENYNKVYLSCENSQNLIEAFERQIKKNNIDIFYDTKVLDIDPKKKLIYTDSEMFSANKVIISTGGLSYPQSGSDGSMLDILRKKGYDIIEPRPGLVPFNLSDKWIKNMPGISFKNIEFSIFDTSKGRKKLIKRIRGEIIFTHRGIGGPAALKVSSYINKDIKKYMVCLDLIPEISEEEFFSICKLESKKAVTSNIKKIFPTNFIKNISDEIENKSIVADFKTIQAANFSKKDFNELLLLTKNIQLDINSLGKIDTATITSGGVNVKNINPNTMESKLDEGIYFAGEMIDVDALTGGYNLQIAFSTGVLAGRSINMNE